MTMNTQRIYVISFAPSYDESGIGGYEYRRSWEDALLALNSIAKLDPGEQDVGSDFRIITLDLPSDMDAGEIVDFCRAATAQASSTRPTREKISPMRCTTGASRKKRCDFAWLRDCSCMLCCAALDCDRSLSR